MLMLKKANRIARLKVRIKTMRILQQEDETRQRIAAALKRQAERIYR